MTVINPFLFALGLKPFYGHFVVTSYYSELPMFANFACVSTDDRFSIGREVFSIEEIMCNC